MYEKLEECPSCKHPKFSNYKICTDHSVSGESFALVSCEKCQLIFTNPRPNIENIGRYYESENYISHTNKANSLTNILYKSVRKITLREKISLIQKYTSKKSILDFGCGTGTFLNYCLENDYQINGVEPNDQARTIAEKSTNTRIYPELSKLKKDLKFDVVTAWHVLEHVHELRENLTFLRKCMRNDGYLFVALPNYQAHDAKHYQEYWAAYDVPRHLYHFTKESFSSLATKCKLKVKSVYPMKYDAYYVSLLSEKYKTGRNRYLKAFAEGYQSNQKAKKTGQYSSLIYVLTK